MNNIPQVKTEEQAEEIRILLACTPFDDFTAKEKIIAINQLLNQWGWWETLCSSIERAQIRAICGDKEKP